MAVVEVGVEPTLKGSDATFLPPPLRLDFPLLEDEASLVLDADPQEDDDLLILDPLPHDVGDDVVGDDVGALGHGLMYKPGHVPARGGSTGGGPSCS